MKKSYLLRHAKDVPATACPCGRSKQIFTRKDPPTANLRVTHIQDSRENFHRTVTEI